ncbi:hypothetical protein K3G39_01235 [Pontibacter sp. HSC-14F20]|uniref:hypothetical protein n=1 Tax=Pontibacter sp. HSC-14F20 TaxID=2864136 RepID=UPI001C72B7B7|nr:hypothetical protein [Pontibacter sp. HSC-14F20]MBX0331853.1 hypothetical protein [Pontibacter sp. HSC-14F20]
MLYCIVHYAVKNILLALSIFFAFYGLQTKAAKELQAQSVQVHTEQGELSFSDKSTLGQATSLLQPEEQLRVWQHRPSAPLKQVSSGSAALVWAQEFRLQLQVVHYLQRARHFSPGLSIRDIIFPFHYFW